MHIQFVMIPAVILLDIGIYFSQLPDIRMVSEIKKEASALDKSDTIVSLKGCVTERISEENFWFQDKSGKIRIEIEDHLVPGFTFTPDRTVLITGEVDYDLLEGTEIEVSEITEAGK